MLQRRYPNVKTHIFGVTKETPYGKSISILFWICCCYRNRLEQAQFYKPVIHSYFN